MRFKGTLFERLGQHGSRVESTFDVPWTEEAVLAVFGDAQATEKAHQQLWSAARYKEGYNRGNAGLEALHAAVLDKDCADIGELDAVCAYLERAGLAYIAYTSWSHLDPEKKTDGGLQGPFECFRIVIPYSRDLTPAEHLSVVPALFGCEVPNDPPKYAKEVQGKFVTTRSGSERAARPRGWDPTCAEPARGYFVPSARSSLDLRQGRPIDVEAVLARPTTAKPSQRRLRPFVAPTSRAIGAVGVMQKALERFKFGWSGPGHSGWYRSTCPACQDPNPSLTFRANGDGIELRCHATCPRLDVLAALGLAGADAFRPPSQLELLLEEQLVRQAPRGRPLPIAEVSDRLTNDIREAMKSREPTVICYPAGSGKSYSSAIVLAELAREGERVVYSTQEHVVAAETRALLPPDVRARSVHIHSPLLKVGDDPVCRRADELKERVFEYGLSLLGQVCPRCPFKDECEALSAAKARNKAIDEANVIFTSHVGIRQLFGVSSDGETKGADLRLIVDEMPGAFEEVHVSSWMLKALAEGAVMPSADASVAKVAQEIARAWLAGEEPGDVRWGLGGSTLGNAMELAQEWGRMSLRDGARPDGGESAALKAADAVLRLAVWKASGGTLDGLDNPKLDGVGAMLPNACHEALTNRKGVLLSATPMLAALPGFRVREVDVLDGAKVKRKMVLRKDRGSGALTQMYYDDEIGVRVRRPGEPGEEPGIPWPIVDAALYRAVEEAKTYGAKGRVLFVTFKTVADALRDSPERLVVEEDGAHIEIEVGHFGALRGKNDWKEGAQKECCVIYCFGTPRMGVLPTLRQLGLEGEAAQQAWIAYAAGELTQAEGRLRLPRRTKPCTVFVEGDIAPLGWHAGNIDEYVQLETRAKQLGTELLEAALVWHSSAAVARALGVTKQAISNYKQPGRPAPSPKHIGTLRKLIPQTPAEACALLSQMSSKRRAQFWGQWNLTPEIE